MASARPLMPFRKNKSVVGRENFGSLIGLAFEDEGAFTRFLCTRLPWSSYAHRATHALAVSTKLWYKWRVEHPMSKNTSFSLGEHFSKFVETQVGKGR